MKQMRRTKVCVMCGDPRQPGLVFSLCGHVVMPGGEKVLMSWCPMHKHYAYHSSGTVMKRIHGSKWVEWMGVEERPEEEK